MSRDFFNQRAARWDETVSERDPNKLERLSRRLEIRSGSAVLDVGTGTGVLIPYIMNKVGRGGRIVAVDFAVEMLKLARAKAFDGNIHYLCADALSLPIRDSSFDHVVCYSSFPHFRDKPVALAEAARVLKDGGTLSTCHTSSRASINGLHRHIPDVHNHLIPGGDEMRRLLSGAGFTDIQIADEADSYLATARKP